MSFVKDNIIDFALPNITLRETEEKEKSSQEMRESLLAMLTVLSSLEILLIQTSTKKSEMNADVGKFMTELAKINQENVRKKVEEYLEQKRKAEAAASAGWFAKIFSAVVSVLVSLVTLNPALIAMTATMVVLEQTGAMDKIGDGISSLVGDDKLLSFFCKLTLTVALCAVGGGASSAYAATNAAKRTAVVMAVSQMANAFQEMGGLHDLIVYHVEHGVSNPTEKEKKEMQEKEAQLELAWGITLSVVISVVSLAGMGLCCANVAESVGNNATRTLYVFSLLAFGMSMVSSLFSAGASTARAITLFGQADAYEALTQSQSEQQFTEELLSYASQMIQQSTEELKKTADLVGQMNQGQDKYTLGDKKMAELLAAMGA
jgi:hypothetical protein